MSYSLEHIDRALPCRSFAVLYILHQRTEPPAFRSTKHLDPFLLWHVQGSTDGVCRVERDDFGRCDIELDEFLDRGLPFLS